MIYLVISSHGRALVASTNAEEAQQCISPEMQLIAAFQTWSGAFDGMDMLQGVIHDVALFSKPLSLEDIREHYKQV